MVFTTVIESKRLAGVVRRAAFVSHCSLLLVGACFSVVAFAAEPYRPTSSDEVLQVLPKSFLQDRSELAQLRARLRDDPTNVKLAVGIANQYIGRGNAAGDPRFYGYAQAALKPWWENPTPPAEVLQIRAKLREKEHRYEEALSDLTMLLEQSPQNAQALIEVANINRVLGRYDSARHACDQLAAFAGPVPNVICRVPIQWMTGEAMSAYESLLAEMPTAKKQFPSTLRWFVTMQAQLAQSLGNLDDAERHYQQGIASDPSDSYLIRSYADFLLDRQRDNEALELTRGHTQDNGILLRAAIAAQRLGRTQQAVAWSQQLERRFEEIRLRGGEPHGRFEARFQLELKQDAQRALEVALANWQQQKELRDARNVLEAALGTKQPAAAEPVIRFLREHGTEDVEVRALIKQLED